MYVIQCASCFLVLCYLAVSKNQTGQYIYACLGLCDGCAHRLLKGWLIGVGECGVQCSRTVTSALPLALHHLHDQQQLGRRELELPDLLLQIAAVMTLGVGVCPHVGSGSDPSYVRPAGGPISRHRLPDIRRRRIVNPVVGSR